MMGYCVDYGAHGTEKLPLKEAKGHLRAFAGLFFLLGFVLAWNFWPEGREVLQRLLIPGEPEVTLAATEELVAQLRSGTDTQEAVAAFCREILGGH